MVFILSVRWLIAFFGIAFTVIALAGLFFLTTPCVADAAGLVPCGGPGEESCQACHVSQLISRVVNWLVAVLSVVASILFAWAGIKLVISQGNEGALTDAKEMFTNVIIGYIIILAGWLLIDTALKWIAKDQVYGVWSAIQCIEQPQAFMAHPIGFEDRSRGTAYPDSVSGSGGFSSQQAASLAGITLPDDKVAAAAAQYGLNDEQVRNLQALMRVESGNACGSGNNPGITSPAGAVGCMQITPATAAMYMPRDQVDSCLRNVDCNIALGVRIYSNLYTMYNGDTSLVFAAYNGGPGANLPSRDCPGMRRWQCQWDDAAQTVPNTGYRETRNYVQRIPQVASQLQR